MSNGSYGIVFLGQAKRLGSFPSHRTVGGTIKVNHSLALGLGCLVIAVGGHGHVLPLILCTYACKTAAADQFFDEIRTADFIGGSVSEIGLTRIAPRRRPLFSHQHSLSH
jgi:hypothetical protein